MSAVKKRVVSQLEFELVKTFPKHFAIGLLTEKKQSTTLNYAIRFLCERVEMLEDRIETLEKKSRS